MNRFLLTIALLLCLAAPSHAEDIVLGNSLPLSGPLGAAGKAARTGMDAYLARVDREGGINGRKVVIRSLDDAYQADRYVDNIRKLLDEQRVEALVLSAGTSNVDSGYSVVQKSGRPLIGALTGASVLRSSDKPLIYHLRASYADEVRRLVDQVAAVSQSRVYAVWQDDGLGRDAFAALEKALKDRKLTLVGQQGVQIAKMDGPALAAAVKASNADALFTLCVTPCAAKVLSSLGSDGSYKLTPYALSIVNGETLAKQVGTAARGTVISQVLPNPHNATTPLVRHYQQDVKQLTGKSEFSYFSLEGYVAAMVAVEAARVAYGSPGKRSMDEAMRTLARREIEGIAVSSGAVRGVRPHPVVLSMIGGDGRLIH
jgi:ABC-type branched-subunit amino acid transport system substrate-binding protein